MKLARGRSLYHKDGSSCDMMSRQSIHPVGISQLCRMPFRIEQKCWLFSGILPCIDCGAASRIISGFAPGAQIGQDKLEGETMGKQTRVSHHREQIRN